MNSPAPHGTPILLIEDTQSLLFIYESVLRRAGHDVVSATSGTEGLAHFRKLRPSVVLLDLMLPDSDGMDLMHEMLAMQPETNVVVITANASIKRAVDAMRAGAHEFLVKPFDEQRLLNAVENACAHTAAKATAPQPEVPGPLGDFIGTSAPMQAVYSKILSVARSMATVFITGESGTGKELCAQAVHAHSPRAKGPFIALNCGAIPSDLLESEVFGHLKGSFTGAISDKPGAAAAADGGTLFLDEICEMDLALQTKLLRFLQTSTITPVGATRPRKVNVRIVCATNRDPHEAVRQGLFREDLYYRLHVVPIHMPPLRERGSDVVEIAETMLARFGAEEGHAFTGLDPEVKALFTALPWPGNVRQLLNVLRNVAVLHEGPVVSSEMLPADLWREARTAGTSAAPAGITAMAQPTPAHAPQQLVDMFAGRTLAEIEQMVIEAMIDHFGGSVPKAARALDVSPSTIYRKRENWKRHEAAE